ncbi:MAG: cytochrome b/b6 domain-containing protein [Syntrophales bacterium]|nr:cytochrome b/b6 domain-containing protein [Syntrophales bacterium]
MMADGIMEEDRNLIRRHGLTELIEHWAIAISGIALIITGLLELPIGRRYYITEIPGFSWAGDYFITLSLHYAAAIVFAAAAFFHLFYHGLRGDNALLPRRGDIKASIAVMKSFFGKGEEPPFHKYLPEQRLAYAGMALLIGLLILSGLIKTYMNLLNPQLSRVIALMATWTHNIAFVLFVFAFIAHLAALVIKPNRPLLRGMFTGSVRLDYARRRHPLWVEAVEGSVTNSSIGVTGDEEVLAGDIEKHAGADSVPSEHRERGTGFETSEPMEKES